MGGRCCRFGRWVPAQRWPLGRAVLPLLTSSCPPPPPRLLGAQRCLANKAGLAQRIWVGAQVGRRVRVPGEGAIQRRHYTRDDRGWRRLDGGRSSVFRGWMHR